MHSRALAQAQVGMHLMANPEAAQARQTPGQAWGEMPAGASNPTQQAAESNPGREHHQGQPGAQHREDPGTEESPRKAAQPHRGAPSVRSMACMPCEPVGTILCRDHLAARKAQQAAQGLGAATQHKALGGGLDPRVPLCPA